MSYPNSNRFESRLFQEYPLPQLLSVWGSRELNTLGISLKELIELVLEELDSDIEIYEHITCYSIRTVLPSNTRVVTSAKLLTPFQGNRYVKHSYDVDTHTLLLRYIPAKVTYKRGLVLSDLETIKGARFQYIKAGVLEKMAAKEISFLSTVKLDSDAGSIDLTGLEDFKQTQHTILETLKDDIMLYSNG